MKRTIRLVLAFLCLMFSCAHGESVIYDGSIVPGETHLLLAPCGGAVEQVSVQPGDMLASGAEMVAIATEKAYAPISGKATGLFAQPGDAAHQIMCIEPEHPFLAYCTNERAYRTTENLMVYAGEKVYLRSQYSESKRHTGEGIVTQADAGGFSVSIISGDLDLNETIQVYRTEDHSNQSCIGSGRVSRAVSQPMQGSGVLLALHVQEGQAVQKGDLLFETVEASPTYGAASLTAQVLAPAPCIVMEIHAAVGSYVKQGQPVAAIAPIGQLAVEISVPEDELYLVKQDQTVQVMLNSQPDHALPGKVTRISHIPKDIAASQAYFTVQISFAAEGDLYVGQGASVTIPAE